MREEVALRVPEIRLCRRCTVRYLSHISLNDKSTFYLFRIRARRATLLLLLGAKGLSTPSNIARKTLTAKKVNTNQVVVLVLVIAQL
jgi:hypothetical protein